MRSHKLLLATLITCCSLFTLASTATANRASQLLGGRTELILVIFPRIVFGGGFGNITCGVTLHGSLHPEIRKVTGELAGMIESVLIDIRNCAESFGVNDVTEVSVLTLPWHLRYVSFTGTLPNIRITRLIQLGMAFHIDFGILGSDARCLYLTNQQIDSTLTGETISRVSVVREAASRPVRPPSTANCPDGTLSGEGTITDLEGAAITVRLT